MSGKNGRFGILEPVTVNCNVKLSTVVLKQEEKMREGARIASDITGDVRRYPSPDDTGMLFQP